MVIGPLGSAARRAVVAAMAAALGFLLACTTTHNYLDPAGPRYEGRHGAPAPPRACGSKDGALKVVTFNIEFSREIDRAIALLRSSEALRDPDILLLQEMDAPGVERIARALGMNYAYFPSTVHPMAHRDYGSAVLSPWPLDEARKLVLPHAAFLTRARRAATSAVVHCGALRIRTMAVHLPAPGSIRTEEREEQVRVILDDLARTGDPVVLGGDFNSRSVAHVLAKSGYRWLTEKLPGTSRGFGRWWSYDHVFARGLEPAGGGPAAAVVDPDDASDHRAVWVRLVPQIVK